MKHPIRFLFSMLLFPAMLLSWPQQLYAQTADNEEELFIIVTREDGRVFVYHDRAIPLSHGFHLYRKVGNSDWQRLTDEPYFPVQNGHQLRQRMGPAWELVKDVVERDDPQGVFLRLRSQTDDAMLVNMAIPELARSLGRLYIDEDAPSGGDVSYRFEIVNDLERPTGDVIEGSGVLTPSVPVAPTGLEVTHEAERITLSWDYPEYDTQETDYVIHFRAFYRRAGSGRIVEPADYLILRFDEGTRFRHHFSVPYLDEEYDFWVQAVDFTGQTASSEPLRAHIYDNVAPPIVRGVRGNANENYHSEITWQVSTDLNLAGYHLYRGRSDEEEYTRLTDDLLAPLQTAWLDTDTQPGVQYRYAVTATDRSGNESELSNPAHVYIEDYIDPEPVAALHATFIEEDETVHLEWTPGEEYDNLRTFQILRRQIHPAGGEGFSQINHNRHTNLRIIDPGIGGEGFREGVSMEYGVVVINESGNRSDTVYTDIQIPVLTPPDPPTMVQTRMREAGRVHFAWNASISRDVTSYRVYRHDVESGSTRILRERERGSRSLRDEEVVIGHRYLYSVSAVDSVGNESEPVQGDTLLAYHLHPPAQARNVQATSAEEGVRISWQTLNDNRIQIFRIYRSNIATGSYSVVGEAEPEQVYYIHPDGTAGEWYKVFPVDASGREARQATAVQAVER